MSRGKFIVIEGGDGAGKDTQIALLRKDVDPERFVFVKDPGGTEIGEKLREIILYRDDVSKKAEFFLYLASRAQLTAEVIEPALQDGKHVVANRFDLSTIAYQIYGRQRLDDIEFVSKVSNYAFGSTRPDLVIYLDCPAEEGLRRTHDSGEKLDRLEKEKLAFHERVREGYKKHLPEYNHVTIDALKSIDDVYQEVKSAVELSVR